MEDGDVIGFTMPGKDGLMDFCLVCTSNKCEGFRVKPDETEQGIICCKCGAHDKFSVVRAIREDEFPEIPTNESLGWPGIK